MDRPRWRVSGFHHELVLSVWGDDAVTGARVIEAREAGRVLAAVLEASPSWGFAARAVDEAARYVRQRFAGVSGLRTTSAREAVFEALSRGLLTAWRADLRDVAAPDDALDTDALMRIPLASTLLPKTWIEIELTDMEGNPRAGERYWIQLTDGSVREGALDRHGRAYFGDLDPGECEIRWPDLDDEATIQPPRATSTPVERELSWIEIELTDMEGNPRPREPYWIKLPSGTVLQGRLDTSGRACFDGIDPGECEIRWPDLDDEATIPALDPTALDADDPAVGRRGAPSAIPDEVAAQVSALEAAAREGMPFCEECERAARSAQRDARR